MSVVSQVILQADDQLRYPTSGELQSIQNFFKSGMQRTRIAAILTENEKRIVEDASNALWKIHPDYIASGGNASGGKERAQCLRDYGWYLRLVTYGVLAGDKEPIESIGLVGAREMYNSLGVPMPGMVDAIKCLKTVALNLLNDADSATTGPYFDFIVQYMES
jgi:allophycocyanin-B